MKRIVAIISPFLLHDVKEALAGIGLQGITVSEVMDFDGNPSIPIPAAPGLAAIPAITPCLKLEIVVDDPVLKLALKSIVYAGRLEPGRSDHLIVQDVTDVVRIRTSETGTAAI